jgi:hypothetical protein
VSDVRRGTESGQFVAQATEMLHKAVEQLILDLNSNSVPEPETLSSWPSVKALLHGRGINMRYLEQIQRGLVSECLSKPYLERAVNERAAQRARGEMEVKTLRFGK